MLRARVIQKPDFPEIQKQIRFGTALGLTNTAKEGQTAVMKALGDNFTLRGQWFKQSMKYGIKIDMARKDNLSAAVKTAADWLEQHETGGTKGPRSGRSVAVPQDGIRKRGQKKIIKADMKPKALIDAGKAFILNTKNGRVVFMRKGKGKRTKLVALYSLEPRVQVKKTSTFYEPIQKVVKERLRININNGIAKALATGGARRGRIGSYGPG